MPRVIPEAYVEDGDIVAPDEINADVQNLLGTFNGRMDRDNLDQDLITEAKVADATFHRMLVSDQTTTTQTITFAAGSGPGSWETLEDDSGAAWIKRVTTLGHSVLDICIGADLELTAGATDVALGIRIDGILYARTPKLGIGDPASGGGPRSSGLVAAMVPVGAGVHVVEAVIMPTSSLSSAATISQEGRHFWCREVRL